MTEREILWRPDPVRAASSQMAAFHAEVRARHAVGQDWEALRRWSVECPDEFWPAFLAFAGIEPSTPAQAPRAGHGMLGTRWFPGLRLNYAQHLLRHDGDAPAIIFEGEPEAAGGAQRVLSWRELRTAVARLARALRADGVGAGDRVAGYLPNLPEAIVAMLATASLGAIWSSCSPDFGVQGVLDRFGQIRPRVLFVADGYTYAGKSFDSLARVRRIVPALPGLGRVVVIPYLHAREAGWRPEGIEGGPPCTRWSGYLGEGEPALLMEQVPFDHPLWILYSSGTTGAPKCIVHGHGGSLVQHMKELMLHCDLRAGERICYFTTCGWMMWNWLVSALGVGATVVLYEGNPGHPDLHRLWRLASDTRLALLGTSPRFLAACQQAGLHPGREHDLSALRCVLSTGSPLQVEQFRWVYDAVRRDAQHSLQLASISGGTDIVSCFMLGNPLLPVRAGEIQCRGLGMDVEAWNEDGRPVLGEKGELVCRSPFPSQPVGFWNDPDGRQYHAAYFEHYPGVWRHGDYLEITEEGGIVVYGRSDATLNPGGVRIGTSEIYRIVEEEPAVADSLVVGRPRGDDVEILLFVMLRPGYAFDEALCERLRAAIAERATRRHVPRIIHPVQGIPYTISGKKVELAVLRILQGDPVPNREALANPGVLAEYEGLDP